MRRPISSKSNTCTESSDVDVTDISGKLDAHYPGRSVDGHQCIGATPIERWAEASAEVSRRHSRSSGDQTEGRNIMMRAEVSNFDDKEDAE